MIKEHERLFQLLTHEASLISNIFNLKMEISNLKKTLNDLTNELNDKTDEQKKLIATNKALETKYDAMNTIDIEMQDLTGSCEEIQQWDRYLVSCHNRIAYLLKRQEMFSIDINRLTLLVEIEKIDSNAQQKRLDACLNHNLNPAFNQRVCSSSEESLLEKVATLQNNIIAIQQNLNDTIITTHAEQTRLNDLQTKVSRFEQTMQTRHDQLNNCSQIENIPLYYHVEFCDKKGRTP